MNEYQKAVARGIENGLNDHFNCKTKKVWLTIEEAKQANKCVMIEIANLINDFGPTELIHELEVLSEKLRERIEQAEEQ